MHTKMKNTSINVQEKTELYSLYLYHLKKTQVSYFKHALILIPKIVCPIFAHDCKATWFRC